MALLLVGTGVAAYLLLKKRVPKEPAISPTLIPSMPSIPSIPQLPPIMPAVTHDAPTRSIPANGTTNVPLAGRLAWNDTGASRYDIYMDIKSPPEHLVKASHIGNTYNYSGLVPNKVFYWRIKALYDDGGTATSAVWQFKTLGGGVT